jgi:hypothetical protein
MTTRPFSGDNFSEQLLAALAGARIGEWSRWHDQSLGDWLPSHEERPAEDFVRSTFKVLLRQWLGKKVGLGLQALAWPPAPR